MSALTLRSELPLLEIESLAAALEKCATVDEIKDVRDRAMALELYARKKKGGLAAAQAAGRVVTDATVKLAELYAAEDDARLDNRRGGKMNSDAGPESRPGKEAVAKAAGLDGAQLRRLAPVVDAAKDAVDAAKTAIESHGGVVTPSALARQLRQPRHRRAPKETGMKPTTTVIEDGMGEDPVGLTADQWTRLRTQIDAWLEAVPHEQRKGRSALAKAYQTLERSVALLPRRPA